MSTEGYEEPYEKPYEKTYEDPEPYKEACGEPQATPPGAGTTAMLIRIFGKKDQEPYGDIVHYHLKKPVPYQGAAELVLRIDAISRGFNLPASESTFRSVRRPRDETGNVLPGEYWQEETASEKTGDTSPPPKVRDTIYLQVFGRQHTSIQGRIWGKATRKRYVSFRSALELIYLLSEAV